MGMNVDVHGRRLRVIAVERRLSESGSWCYELRVWDGHTRVGSVSLFSDRNIPAEDFELGPALTMDQEADRVMSWRAGDETTPEA